MSALSRVGLLDRELAHQAGQRAAEAASDAVELVVMGELREAIETAEEAKRGLDQMIEKLRSAAEALSDYRRNHETTEGHHQ
jgi:hypothetical protein